MVPQQRYDIEFMDGAYYIFDTSKRTSLVHLMSVVPVVRPDFNWQVVIAAYDAGKDVDHEFHVLSHEVYSTFFYAANEGIKQATLRGLFSLLQLTEVHNPTDLVVEYGGSVLNERVPMPRFPYTH